MKRYIIVVLVAGRFARGTGLYFELKSLSWVFCFDGRVEAVDAASCDGEQGAKG